MPDIFEIPAWPNNDLLDSGVTGGKIEKIDNHIKKSAQKMINTMLHFEGIGLAAVQVCLDLMMFSLYVPRAASSKNMQGKRIRGDYTYYVKKPMVFINPEIIEKSEEKSEMTEGCLSMPGIDVQVERTRFITVKFLDIAGEEQIMKADGLLAACIQHEIDHLNGILIWDYITVEGREKLQEKLSENL